MSKRIKSPYDAVIIGTGQAGTPLAHAFAGKNYKVAIIEKGEVGGSCLNYGCTPTKAMIASAKAAYMGRRAGGFGVNTGKVRIDFKQVMKRKNKIVKTYVNGNRKRLEETSNIELIFGEASFKDSKTVIVKVKNEEIAITGEKVFINTGAKPNIPPVKGLDKVSYLDFHSIMKLKELPSHLIVLGGGYIGLEFGQMFRRFGSKVTIIEAGDKFLAREDRDIADEIKSILEEDGIKVLTGAKASDIKENKRGEIEIKFEGGLRKVKGSHLLVAIGIKPATESLNLKAAGVEVNERGYIKVNDKLETNVSGIYALGDVNGGPAFTHISYDDYRIIKANLLDGGSSTTKDRLVPYTLFTDPELGRIGLSEEQAKEKGIHYKTAVMPMQRVARAFEKSETRGFMKALIDPETEKILGCAVLGIEGGEIMSMIEIAMIGGIKYTQLKDAVFAHPTLAESLNNLFGKVK